MTKLGYTHVQVLVDRSGSMVTTRVELEKGFADFLTAQRALPGECSFGLDQFDETFESILQWENC